ncbi:hypothetical protein ACFTSD_13825 [Nocardiaceae bacterium NPDC056970]
MLQRNRELRLAAFLSLIVVGHFVEDRRRRDRLSRDAAYVEQTHAPN